MRNILAGIHTPTQHFLTLIQSPEQYRPKQCAHCFSNTTWRHGRYLRQAQCEHHQPIPIPRFRCANKDCGCTCSTLPEFIPPRRWYHWQSQQMAVTLLVMGNSLMKTVNALCLILPVEPCISTIQRWSRRLKEQWRLHQSHLCEEYPALRFQHTWLAFWRTYFGKDQQRLSQAMIALNRARIVVP